MHTACDTDTVPCEWGIYCAAAEGEKWTLPHNSIAFLAILLREYRTQVEMQRLLLGKPLTHNDLCFAHPDGSPLDPPTVTHHFLKIARRTGLKARLHDLRHTYASIMLAAGVNIKAISQALGHANVSITLNIYSHLLPGTGKSAAEKFDKLLEPWLNENVDRW